MKKVHVVPSKTVFLVLCLICIQMLSLKTYAGTLDAELRTISCVPPWGGIALHSSGKELFIATAKKGVLRLDLTSAKVLHIFTGHAKNQDVSIALSPDGNLLATGGRKDGLIILWDIASNKKIREIQAHKHKERITALAFSPDSKALASCSNDTTVKIWDVKSGRNVWSFGAEEWDASASDVAYSKLGEFVAVAYNKWHGYVSFNEEDKKEKYRTSSRTSQRVLVFRANDGALLKTLNKHSGGLTDVHFANNDQWIVTHSFTLLDSGELAEYYPVYVWDWQTGKLIHVLKHSRPIFASAVSPNGKYLLTLSERTGMRLWDLMEGKLVHEFLNTCSNDVHFFSNGVEAVTGAGKLGIGVWNLRDYISENVVGINNADKKIQKEIQPDSPHRHNDKDNRNK